MVQMIHFMCILPPTGKKFTGAFMDGMCPPNINVEVLTPTVMVL